MSRILIADCFAFVCEIRAVPSSLMMSGDKSRAVTNARALGCWLARRHTSASLQSIAPRFGVKDPTCVLRNIRRGDHARDDSPEFAATIARIDAEFLIWVAPSIAIRILTNPRSASPVSAQQSEPAR
jgi:chromosomal replication initiation ATPase DnaA